MLPNETTAQFIERKLKLTAAAKDAPAADPAKPAVAEPGKEAAKPAAEAKTEATPAEEEGMIPLEDITLESTGLLDPAGFNEALKNAPELLKNLDAAPQLKNQLFKTMRIAAQAGEVLKELPSLEAAKFAKAQTEFVAALRSDLTNVDDPEAMPRFFQRIDEESRITDENGQPVKDAAGNFQTDGSGERMVKHVMSNALAALERNAIADKNEDLQAALKIIRDATEAPSSQAKDGLTEAQLAKQAELDQRDGELQRQDRETKQAARKQSETQLSDRLKADLEKNIDRVFGQTSISEFNKSTAKQKIMGGFVERIGQDPLYKAQRDYLAAQVQTPAIVKQRASLFHGALKQYLVEIASPILKDAGAEMLGKQAAKADKIDAQTKASAAEPKGASAQPLPNPAATSSDDPNLIPAFRAEFTKANGRKPTLLEEVTHSMKSRIASVRK